MRNKTKKPSLRRAAWTLFADERVLQDIARRQANLRQHGARALCQACDGTGNSYVYIHVPCSHCDGTGVLAAPEAVF